MAAWPPAACGRAALKTPGLQGINSKSRQYVSWEYLGTHEGLCNRNLSASAPNQLRRVGITKQPAIRDQRPRWTLTLPAWRYPAKNDAIWPVSRNISNIFAFGMARWCQKDAIRLGPHIS